MQSLQPMKTSTSSVKQPSHTMDVLAAVHNELMEKQRRKCNVVVSGLKEVEGVDDVDAFCEICKTCLPVKPPVNRQNCRRLGRKTTSKIRPLLITLVNESSAAELIQCAPLLRQSSEATGIYINADLTAAEALAGFQARERRHARRSARGESVPSTSVAVRPTTDPTTCSPVPHRDTVACS